MKKLIALLLALVMVLGTFAACTTEDTNNTTAPAQQDEPTDAPTQGEEVDVPQETVNIVWHRTTWHDNVDEKMVEDAINAYIEPLIGVTVTMYNDAQMALNTSLAAGEDIDLFWTASWSDGTTYQSSGAALDLTDIVKNYPALYNSMPEVIWEGSLFNGRNYYVPVYKEAASAQGITVPTAMVDKYGWDLSAVKEFADIEPMLADMAADGVDYPIYMKGNSWSAWASEWFETFEYHLAMGVRYDDPTKIVLTIDTDEYREYVEMVNRWMELGYINASETVQGTKNGHEGELMAAGEMGFHSWAMTPDSEGNASGRYDCPISVVQLSPSLLQNGGTFGSAYMINANSTKVDACMKFLELLFTDETLANLACFGIEGEHYNVTDEGRIELIADSGYSYAGVWIVTNVHAPSLLVGEAEDKKAQYDEFNATAEVAGLYGFEPDLSGVSAEVSAINAVYEEYAHMLETGFYEVDMVDEYIQAMKDAGCDTVLAEIQAQLDAWNASK